MHPGYRTIHCLRRHGSGACAASVRPEGRPVSKGAPAREIKGDHEGAGRRGACRSALDISPSSPNDLPRCRDEGARGSATASRPCSTRAAAEEHRRDSCCSKHVRRRWSTALYQVIAENLKARCGASAEQSWRSAKARRFYRDGVGRRRGDINAIRRRAAVAHTHNNFTDRDHSGRAIRRFFRHHPVVQPGYRTCLTTGPSMWGRADSRPEGMHTRRHASGWMPRSSW